MIEIRHRKIPSFFISSTPNKIDSVWMQTAEFEGKYSCILLGVSTLVIVTHGVGL
jgi:hypothetical protein